ncbi:peptide-N4-(N-acetyl-beta-D-glucosaminyl) asparaginase amidase N [Aspergillus niger]|uniref:Uncharacterized protein n=1 Tax=Aspergillus niger ATCC 13496 TaxID=1353008 RepID=A0A370BPN9_ASPNG|nr:hypothetical protein M747DRAFT_297995 [Aspergillus niger ATCC 13496]GJP96315.1 peptide-N4-(N-acetyl-beta-D-glucosaminyl) asparaginase amidase N [Aspergillus niger]
MDYIPCSFDAFIDNFLACYRPCYSDYLQQLVANGTCGANYTTLAASTDRSDLKCICENANGVSNNWTSQVLECTHSSCNGTFNYTRWADSMWSYDNMCYYASGTAGYKTCSSSAASKTTSTAGLAIGLLALSQVFLL